ncbi:hypothetical protein F5Y16DRAFT_398774 [Xylariaceae sp. FL0255]|nr:hypothetical protein F5Y16DRAFT_398774 [Xylariaceae sp. FL0255]
MPKLRERAAAADTSSDDGFHPLFHPVPAFPPDLENRATACHNPDDIYMPTFMPAAVQKGIHLSILKSNDFVSVPLDHGPKVVAPVMDSFAPPNEPSGPVPSDSATAAPTLDSTQPAKELKKSVRQSSVLLQAMPKVGMVYEWPMTLTGYLRHDSAVTNALKANGYGSAQHQEYLDVDQAFSLMIEKAEPVFLDFRHCNTSSYYQEFLHTIKEEVDWTSNLSDDKQSNDDDKCSPLVQAISEFRMHVDDGPQSSWILNGPPNPYLSASWDDEYEEPDDVEYSDISNDYEPEYEDGEDDPEEPDENEDPGYGYERIDWETFSPAAWDARLWARRHASMRAYYRASAALIRRQYPNDEDSDN